LNRCPYRYYGECHWKYKNKKLRYVLKSNHFSYFQIYAETISVKRLSASGYSIMWIHLDLFTECGGDRVFLELSLYDQDWYELSTPKSLCWKILAKRSWIQILGCLYWASWFELYNSVPMIPVIGSYLRSLRWSWESIVSSIFLKRHIESVDSWPDDHVFIQLWLFTASFGRNYATRLIILWQTGERLAWAEMAKASVFEENFWRADMVIVPPVQRLLEQVFGENIRNQMFVKTELLW